MFRRLLVLLSVAALALAAPAAGVTVHLRVEGLAETFFDGDVDTSPHEVMGHTCDGTNGGANPEPGPTMTGALDDAGLDWSGTWFESFEDFTVDMIGPDAADLASSRFWGLVLDYRPTAVGGCQQQVEAGDELLFAYDLFSKAHVLRLHADPAVARVGEEVLFHVVDGQDGAPVASASVGGVLTDAAGTAAVAFGTPGSYVRKAEKDDSIRSNMVAVCVYDPALGGCGVAPQAGPAPPPPAPAPTATAPPPAAPFAPPSEAPCTALEVSPRRARLGRRIRLTVLARVEERAASGITIVLRGPGIAKRSLTDGDGVARLRVRPRGAGSIRVYAWGEAGRCGAERVLVRGR